MVVIGSKKGCPVEAAFFVEPNCNKHDSAILRTTTGEAPAAASTMELQFARAKIASVEFHQELL